jgi:hypothetical protein
MDQNDPDYQEYQQYLEYLKHPAHPSQQRPSTQDIAKAYIPKGSYQDQAVNFDPVAAAEGMAGAGPAKATASAVGKGVKQAGSYVGQILGKPGVVNDLLSLASPRLGKLASLLGKIAPEVEGGATQAVKQAAPEAASVVEDVAASAPKPKLPNRNPNWDFPVRKTRE